MTDQQKKRLEDYERVLGGDFAKFIRDFPKGFEMPIRSLEDFEKMVRRLPCYGGSRCPHCRALALVEKLRMQEEWS